MGIRHISQTKDRKDKAFVKLGQKSFPRPSIPSPPPFLDTDTFWRRQKKYFPPILNLFLNICMGVFYTVTFHVESISEVKTYFFCDNFLKGTVENKLEHTPYIYLYIESGSG